MSFSQADHSLLTAHLVGVLAANSLDPSAVVEVQLNAAKRFAFVEFSSPRVATRMLALLRDNVGLGGKALKVGRPASYVPPRQEEEEEEEEKGRGGEGEREPKRAREDNHYDDWPSAVLREARAGDEMAWKSLELDADSWMPVLGREWHTGRVKAFDQARGLVWMEGGEESVAWTSMMTPKKRERK